MSGVFECEDGKVVVSLSEEDTIVASEVKGISIIFACQFCKTSFENAADIIAHVKSKHHPVIDSSESNEVNKNAEQVKNSKTYPNSKSKAKKSKPSNSDWKPPKDQLINPSFEGRATRVRTGSLQKKSILDIIGNVSERKHNALQPLSKPENGVKSLHLMSKKRGRRKKNEISHEESNQFTILEEFPSSTGSTEYIFISENQSSNAIPEISTNDFISTNFVTICTDEKSQLIDNMESDLKTHISSVHDEMYKCGHCPFQTNSAQSMLQHSECHNTDLSSDRNIVYIEESDIAEVNDIVVKLDSHLLYQASDKQEPGDNSEIKDDAKTATYINEQSFDNFVEIDSNSEEARMEKHLNEPENGGHINSLADDNVIIENPIEPFDCSICHHCFLFSDEEKNTHLLNHQNESCAYLPNETIYECSTCGLKSPDCDFIVRHMTEEHVETNDFIQNTPVLPEQILASNELILKPCEYKDDVPSTNLNTNVYVESLTRPNEFACLDKNIDSALSVERNSCQGKNNHETNVTDDMNSKDNSFICDSSNDVTKDHSDLSDESYDMTDVVQEMVEEEIKVLQDKKNNKKFRCNLSNNVPKQRFFKCLLCKQRFFATAEELELHSSLHVQHLGKEHLGKEQDLGKEHLSYLMEEYKCTICDYHSVVWARMIKHVTVHEEIRSKYKDCEFFKNYLGRFICDVCNKLFLKKDSYKMHYEKVHRKLSRKCPHCKIDVGKVDDKTFKRHSEKCSGKILSCMSCPYLTKVSANLRKHMKIHNGKGFKCNSCGAIFPTKQRYETHLLIHNENRKKFLCLHCQAEFFSAISVQKHIMRTHHRNKHLDYKCTECEYKSNMETDLKTHISSVHDKMYKCGHCPFQTNSAQSMLQHSECHNTDLSYPCGYENCYYRGPSKKHLKTHINQVHSVTNNHQCPLCLKVYKKKVHLARHLVSHTNDRPYQCAQCSETFVTHSSYYRHRNRFGHDKKREGVVSIPQNISIHYVNSLESNDTQLNEGAQTTSTDVHQYNNLRYFIQTKNGTNILPNSNSSALDEISHNISPDENNQEEVETCETVEQNFIINLEKPKEPEMKDTNPEIALALGILQLQTGVI